VISKLARACTAAAIVVSTRVALACPLCAENMSKDVYGKNPTQLGRGFFWSIMLMMAAPFLTVAFVGVKVVLARRRARRSSPDLNAVPEATS
jgi:heme/copper-type cytochrome/quinol oxidase subunit 2